MTGRVEPKKHDSGSQANETLDISSRRLCRFHRQSIPTIHCRHTLSNYFPSQREMVWKQTNSPVPMGRHNSHTILLKIVSSASSAALHFRANPYICCGL